MGDEGQGSKVVKALGWAAVLIGAAVGGALGTGIGEEVSSALLGESTSDVLDRVWSPVAVGDLTLQLPEPLEPIDLPFTPQDQETIAETTSLFEAYQSNVGVVTVAVSHVVYQPEVTVDLRGAAQGSVQRMRAEADAADSEVQHTEITVSGLPAIRTSMLFTVDGSSGRAEAISVARGQELWQVQTIFPDGPVGRQVAERVLRSIAVGP